MLELTFNFSLGTFNLSFSKINSQYSLKAKAKEQEKKGRKRKRKIKMNNVELGKRRKKSFCLSPMSEKSILCDLVKTYLLIPLFKN